jgi:hypothetical protein
MTTVVKKPVVKEAAKDGGFSGKAKNISKFAIQLSGKSIAPGEVGECTPAELSVFFKYLEKV